MTYNDLMRKMMNYFTKLGKSLEVNFNSNSRTKPLTMPLRLKCFMCFQSLQNLFDKIQSFIFLSPESS